MNATNKLKSFGSFFLALSAPILATTALLRYNEIKSFYNL
ncbi:hypothetical protein HMPREF1519_0041 [Streptococcus sp. SR4]|nr:hypothetical protein HMPREF1519_0041 [Streptococcus sp. SR4]